jgi:hypothetical protein
MDPNAEIPSRTPANLHPSHEQLVAELAQQRQLILQLTSLLQPSSSTNTPSLKPPKPPTFSGSRTSTTAENWLFQFRQYFDVVPVSEQQQVAFASTFLRDHAATWWRARVMAADSGRTERIISWQQFQTALLAEFQPVNLIETARDRLDGLRQTSSVQNYARRFREIAMLIPDLNDGEALHKFVSGLKPLIKREVKTRFPKSLEDVIRLADMVDTVAFVL